MAESDYNPIQITIDMKKSRLRIFKSTLHHLGDPKYIMLLANPEKKLIAIKAQEKRSRESCDFQVSKQRLLSDNSIEIYGDLFVHKLNDITDIFKDGNTYSINGKLVDSDRAALFQLQDAVKYIQEDI